jgi:hypothetical protein
LELIKIKRRRYKIGKSNFNLVPKNIRDIGKKTGIWKISNIELNYDIKIETHNNNISKQKWQHRENNGRVGFQLRGMRVGTGDNDNDSNKTLKKQGT